MRTTRSGKSLEVDNGINPVAKRARNLRRSVRIQRCSNVECSPEKVDLYGKKYARKTKKNKQELLGFEEELPEENVNRNDHDEQPPEAVGHVLDAAGDVGWIEVSSSDEENKPQVNPLLILKPVSKLHPQLQLEPREHETLLDAPREHETLLDAAAILKSKLVSELSNSANKLTVTDMVDHTNNCCDLLKGLNAEYYSFHSEIRQLIELHEELDLAIKEKNSWNGLELEHIHEKCVANYHEAEEELHRAQDNLICFETGQGLLRTKIKELTETLSKLEDEEEMRLEKIKTLIAERDRWSEACPRALHELKNSDSKMKEAAATMDRIKARCDAAKEGIERMHRQLHRIARN